MINNSIKFLNVSRWFNIKNYVAISALWIGYLVPAYASFQLETMTVILNEAEGRSTFTIKNIGNEPLLLATKVTDLDKNQYSKQILISPPITRIDGGQSQQINFVLKKGEPLTQEVMLKASFEGVGQSTENSARMPVRQSIAMIVQPAAVAVDATPWKGLSAHVDGSHLVLKNTSKHVVRLSPQLELLPNNETVTIENYFLIAGEEKRIAIKSKPTSLKITPLSRFGFKQSSVSIPLK
ncbi:fimbria/pilus chaperone family protein [Providencia sp. JUb39]|uniref:fimbria/pilus chaperone family protein n=1 Tax=Providencia sp. JUb39 TaxID=2724165 RepID=UPI00164DCE07|nr:fimbria/pilus chaperone family protein [Providencia sp. JUb39]MBC5791439.1 fimbria/pilus periplasmic chaperone [Providencia sp. JUb39]